jgi:hypothetical protein
MSEHAAPIVGQSCIESSTGGGGGGGRGGTSFGTRRGGGRGSKTAVPLKRRQVPPALTGVPDRLPRLRPPETDGRGVSTATISQPGSSGSYIAACASLESDTQADGHAASSAEALAAGAAAHGYVAFPTGDGGGANAGTAAAATSSSFSSCSSSSSSSSSRRTDCRLFVYDEPEKHEHIRRTTVFDYADRRAGFTRLLPGDSLIFQSHFESGNLLRAQRVPVPKEKGEKRKKAAVSV